MSTRPRPSVMSRAVLGVLGLGWLAMAGCAREKHEITPTTMGTDLTTIPRGKITPFPWPGSDLSQARPRPGSPTTDPDASLASGPAEGR